MSLPPPPPACRITLDTARRHLIARVEELSEERELLRMEREGTVGALSRCQAQLKETESELNRCVFVPAPPVVMQASCVPLLCCLWAPEDPFLPCFSRANRQ